MLQHKFTKLLTILAVSTGLSVVAPAITQLVNPASTTVKAATLAKDGPWETSDDGEPMIQPLHNGNEIYYSIAPNDQYTQVFQNAVDDWNALGVIKLVQVNWGDTQSQINMSTAPTNSDGSDTNGDTSFGAMTVENNEAIMHTTTINVYPTIKHLNQLQKQVVAQHELGHALGFDHDNRKFKFNGKKYRNYRMVMNEYGNYTHYYRLGGIEQHMLADHYNLTPSVDLSDLNC